jgi:hypothetical protein
MSMWGVIILLIFPKALSPKARPSEKQRIKNNTSSLESLSPVVQLSSVMRSYRSS